MALCNGVWDILKIANPSHPFEVLMFGFHPHTPACDQRSSPMQKTECNLDRNGQMNVLV